MTEDFDAGYEKIFLELQAIGWNAPEVRQRVARVFTEWYEILIPAFDAGIATREIAEEVEAGE